MVKNTFKVKGMYCTGCETRIENKLKRLKGVKSVQASYNKEEALIEYDDEKVTIPMIKDALEDIDYELILNDENTTESKIQDFQEKLDNNFKEANKKESEGKVQIISLLVIIIALYIIFDHLGWLAIFNIFPQIENTMTYGMLFVVGLLTSVHCIAMCGGINLSQSVLSARNGESSIKSNLYYNIGRVISYTIIGGIVGLIGSVFAFNSLLKGAILILAGIMMLIMSINMLGIFPAFRKFSIRIPKRIVSKLNQSKKGRSSFYIGLVNGLMPCGPLQSMQIYALSTGSFVGGAFSMFLFSLGTVPLMFAFGTIVSKLNRKFANRMMTVSAIIIFILGLGMLRNGFGLSGINVSGIANGYENQAIIVDDHQEVATEVDYGSYEPITVKKNIPVKWNIHVAEGKLNGCNGKIIAEEFDIEIKLQEGDNIVEFTPTKAGSFVYSCWMGMIVSSINVID